MSKPRGGVDAVISAIGTVLPGSQHRRAAVILFVALLSFAPFVRTPTAHLALLCARSMTSSINKRPLQDVGDFPRPPALERTPLTLTVVWKAVDGMEFPVAKTTEGYRVLETT